jgi:hypothetical protein
MRRSASKKGRCSECQKTKVIHETFPSDMWGAKQFCKGCSYELHRQPEVRRRHKIADNNDRCTCGHEAFHHWDDDGSRFHKLERCRAEICSCKKFILVP